jgi:hypothetical protein
MTKKYLKLNGLPFQIVIKSPLLENGPKKFVFVYDNRLFIVFPLIHLSAIATTTYCHDSLGFDQ